MPLIPYLSLELIARTVKRSGMELWGDAVVQSVRLGRELQIQGKRH